MSRIMCRMSVQVAMLLGLVAACDGFSYSECWNVSNPILRVDEVVISPTTVKMPGTLNLTFQVTVLRPITENLSVDITMKKSVWLIEFTIPCVYEIGSCSYTLCDWLPKHHGPPCPMKLQGSNINCNCPVQPGIYRVKDETLQIPDVPLGLNVFVAGDYKIRATLRDTATNEVVGCYDMEVNVKA